ncbi:hypothetical protein Lal_00017038 [Lupinus albus]|nr:hypothetical protein Lal_00017038 [Lupinus albus]
MPSFPIPTQISCPLPTFITLVPPFFSSHHSYTWPNVHFPIPNPNHSRPPKLQLSPFDGFEPLVWLFQAKQFFQLYQVSPDQRMQLISCYMKDKNWENITRSIETRFGLSCYENHQAELFKLHQIGTFEKLLQSNLGVIPDVILNCFISGLIPEIICELAVLRSS